LGFFIAKNLNMNTIKLIIKTKRNIKMYEDMGDVRSILIEQSFLSILREKMNEKGRYDREDVLRKIPTM
jgi:hypothetical protein